MKRVTSGISLLELLVALMMSAVVIVGVAGAYTEAIAFDRQNTQAHESADARIQLEDQIRSLLQGAFVSSSATDSSTYFLGDESGNVENTTAADTLIFTTMSVGLNGSEINDTTDDSETLNQTYGTQGGVTEIALSMTAVGDNGQSKQGLFMREQRPADGDPTQGGYETLLSSDVKSIMFEFYDGANWDPTWSTSGVNAQSTTNLNIDTSGVDGRRIPAAVRVTYTLNNDPDEIQHVFIVRLPLSDVTAENPVVTTGTTTTP